MTAKDFTKIAVFGDSFPAGTYRREEDFKLNSETDRLETSFVHQLEVLTGIPCENHGRHANSNLGIHHDVWKYIIKNAEKMDTFFLICWTGILRTGEYSSETQRFENEKERYLSRDLDYTRECWVNYNYIVATYNLLTKFGVNFKFTSSFLDYKTSVINGYLDKDIKDKWIEWDRPNNTLYNIVAENFLQDTTKKYSWWLNHAQYTEDTPYIHKMCKHPNKEGHKLIAETIQKYLTCGINVQNLTNYGIDQNIHFDLTPYHPELFNGTVEFDPGGVEEANFKKGLKDPKWATKLEYYLKNKLEYRINNVGSRGPNVDVDKEMDIFIGCSFTHGIGVHEEFIWPTLVAKELNSPNYLNLGISGTGIDTWYRLFKYAVKHYKVRRVFVYGPAHPRLEVKIKSRNVIKTVAPFQIERLLKEEKEDREAILHTMDLIADKEYIVEHTFKTLLAMKSIAEGNNIEFYCYGFYDGNFYSTPKEKQIARDIAHPGQTQHRLIADVFLYLEKNKISEINIKESGY